MKSLVTIISLCVFIFNVNAQLSFTNQHVLLGNPDYISEHPIAVLDMDGDKRDDIVVLDSGLYLKVHYQNLPNQTFTPYVHPNNISYSKVWGLCAGDVNQDGYADVIYGGAYDSISVVTSNGGPSNYSHVNYVPLIFMQGMSMADIDHDNDLDFYACHDDGPGLIMLGDGAGNFTPDTTRINTNLPNGSDNSGNYGSIFTDFDNDGDLDLYVAKCRQGVISSSDPRRINILFENDGNGFYTETASNYNLASGDQSWSAEFGDIDNDGDMDLFIGQHSTHSQILLNDGTGIFTDVTATSGINGTMTSLYNIESVFEDFDNDGWLDLLVSGGGEFLFCMNNGNGTFDTTSDVGMAIPMNSFALGDLNSDGAIDIYATPGGYGAWTASGTDSLFFNDGNSNNFLTITFDGVISNDEGIGARVEIYGPWGIQLREVRSGVSYGIQNSLNAHFGLGTESTVDSVIVRWPSGIVDGYYNVASNQFFHVVEGETPWSTPKGFQAKINIYPNPSTDKIMLTLDERFIGTSLSIMNASGQLVETIKVTDLHPVVDISTYAKGEYHIQFWDRTWSMATKTFIKQ